MTVKIGVIFYSPHRKHRLNLSHFVIFKFSIILSCLSSVAAGSSPEEPVEKPPEGLQPDGAAGGQRLPPSHRHLLPQFDTDHGRGRCIKIYEDVCLMFDDLCDEA